MIISITGVKMYSRNVPKKEKKKNQNAEILHLASLAVCHSDQDLLKKMEMYSHIVYIQQNL